MIFKVEDLEKMAVCSYTLVHIGASNCQEASYYDTCHFKRVIWIEALEEIFLQGLQVLKDFPNQEIYKYLLSDSEDKSVDFFSASNNGESSSLLRPALHKRIHKSVNFGKSKSMKTTTLNSVLNKHSNSRDRFILVLDVQGAEKMVLDGANLILQRVDAIFTEISAIPLYKGQVLFADLNREISQLGFTLTKHDLSINSPYGDALYLRGKHNEFQTQKSIVNLSRLIRVRFSRLGIFSNKLKNKLKLTLRSKNVK